MICCCRSLESARKEGYVGGKVVVVQAEATSTSANTVEIIESLWKSRIWTVLSDRICSFVAIDDGSLEQLVGWMDGWKI